MLFLFFNRETCRGWSQSKLKWLWWNINLHKKIITEKETGKLNSLRREWFIVLWSTEHWTCLVLWSEINSAFSSRLTYNIASDLTRFQQRRENFYKHHDVMIMIKHLGFARNNNRFTCASQIKYRKIQRERIFCVHVTAYETSQNEKWSACEKANE